MKTQRILRFTLAAFLAWPLLIEGSASAMPGNTTEIEYLDGAMVVPYEAFLTRDNRPVEGPIRLRIELWDSPTEVGRDEHLQYAESQEATAQEGMVSIGIGSGVETIGNLADAVLDGERLWLAIGIEETPGSPFMLSQRQPIEVAPYSAWSNHAANMTVAGSIQAGGNFVCDGSINAARATVTGRLQARSISSTGGVRSAQDITAAGGITTTDNVEVDGDIAALNGTVNARWVRADSLFSADSFHMANINTSRAIITELPIRLASLSLTEREDGAPEIATALHPLFSFWDAARDPGITVYDAELAVTEGGSIVTNGDIEATGNVHGTCRWTGWTQRSATFSGSTPPGSDYNERTCPDGRFMANIDFAHRNNEHDAYQEYYRIRCCEL